MLIAYSGSIFTSLPQTKKQRVLDPLLLTCLSTRLLILKMPQSAKIVPLSWQQVLRKGTEAIHSTVKPTMVCDV